MAISWLGKTPAVRNFIAAVQSSANAAVDASKGSVTLAFGQAVTGAFLWLQGLLAKVLLLTRAATSYGADLDSFFADFFFYRLAAAFATGQVTFSRATTTLQAVVPIGQLVSTGPGGVQFIVTEDPSHISYSAELGGYVLPPATASITVPVSAVASGVAGNILANTLTSFVSPISGVDSVTNANPFVSGADAEQDVPFRARFQDYIASLVKGTPAAIRFAVLSTRQGLACVIIENKAVDLSTDNGFVTVVVDDGTGAPSDAIVTAAALAVDAVRAAGIRFGVIKPVVTNVVITLQVTSTDANLHAADTAAARAAILAYVNTLPIGAKLVWARLYQFAFDATANISDVDNILINGGNTDIAINAKGLVKTNSVTVT